MDWSRISHLAHRRHPLACPFGDDKVAAIVERLELPAEASVLEIGCGRAEWLLRILDRFPTARAIGVDTSEPALRVAEREAEARRCSERLELAHSDAGTYLGAHADTHALGLCAGATHALGGTSETFRALAERAPGGGRVLVADGYWMRPPTEAALEALGGVPADSIPADLDALMREATEHGLSPRHVWTSTLDEWDDYEWSWVASLEEHSDAHPDDEDGPEIRRIAAQHRDGYIRGYRGVLGFAAVLSVKS